MSPQAIQTLIELFGVEKGLHILNVFTATDDADIARHDQWLRSVRKPPGNGVHVPPSAQEVPAK